MHQALILNASFEPLHVVSWQKAIQLLFQGKVEVIEEYNECIRSVRFSLRLPAVLKLREYVPLRKKQGIKLTRANIFLRDQNLCQYCKRNFQKGMLTLDHVIPIVQGGRKSWENIVTACKPCNQKKGGRTPSQAKMTLSKPASYPTWISHELLGSIVSSPPELWLNYLPELAQLTGATV